MIQDVYRCILCNHYSTIVPSAPGPRNNPQPVTTAAILVPGGPGGPGTEPKAEVAAERQRNRSSCTMIQCDPTLIASDAEQLAKRPHRTTPAERNVQSTAPGTLNFQSEPVACLCISLYIPATAHGRLKTTLPEDAQSLRG